MSNNEIGNSKEYRIRGSKIQVISIFGNGRCLNDILKDYLLRNAHDQVKDNAS